MFDGVLARGGVREAVSDRAWLQAMLDAEAAFARAMRLPGADAIAAACRPSSTTRPSWEPPRPRAGTRSCRWWRRCGRAQASTTPHRGATSQDILDTAGDARHARRPGGHRGRPARRRRGGGAVGPRAPRPPRSRAAR